MAFYRQANGSILHEGDEAVGSELIGQPFSAPKYFWGRLSATGPVPYNAAASSGSNYGPLNPALKEAAEARIARLRQYALPDAAGAGRSRDLRRESGLDPHISLAAAEYQVPRVCQGENNQ